MLVVKKDPGIRGAINRGQQEMAIIMRARLGGGTGATEVTSLVGSVDLSGRVSQEGFLASCLDWLGGGGVVRVPTKTSLQTTEADSGSLRRNGIQWPYIY